MPDPYLCVLYIETNEEIDALTATTYRLVDEIFEQTPAEAVVYRNKNFKETSQRTSPYDFIECSKYYAEISVIDEAPEHIPSFQTGIARLVSDLRNKSRFVTASCNFEEFIADQTGWNWTTETTEPPGRTIAQHE